MAHKYRVAVIGRTGKGNYGHGLDVVWKEIDNVEIVAVADDDEKGRAAAAKRLGAKNAYADYRAMLEKEKPQIVSVADRFLDLHRDMVVACAEAGASMFLEKPMARTLAEADEMVAACETHHVKLAIAHQTRYSPRLARVKELIADGKLGDLLEMRGRGKEDTRGGGEDLMVLGTHIFDLMRFLAGDAALVLRQGRCRTASPSTKARRAPGRRGHGADRRRPHQRDATASTRASPATFGTHKSHGTASARASAWRSTARKGVIHDDHRQPAAGVVLRRPVVDPGQEQGDVAGDHQRRPRQAGDAEGRRPGAGQRLDREGPDRGDREGPPAARQHVRRPGGAGDDPRGVRVAPRGGPVELPLKKREHPLAGW